MRRCACRLCGLAVFLSLYIRDGRKLGVFRCDAPEPRLAYGSASGARRYALVARVYLRRCRPLCFIASVDFRCLQQAKPYQRGAGGALPRRQMLTRRNRAEGEAWSGALAPEGLRFNVFLQDYASVFVLRD